MQNISGYCQKWPDAASSKGKRGRRSIVTTHTRSGYVCVCVCVCSIRCHEEHYILLLHIPKLMVKNPTGYYSGGAAASFLWLSTRFDWKWRRIERQRGDEDENKEEERKGRGKKSKQQHTYIRKTRTRWFVLLYTIQLPILLLLLHSISLLLHAGILFGWRRCFSRIECALYFLTIDKMERESCENEQRQITSWKIYNNNYKETLPNTSVNEIQRRRIENISTFSCFQFQFEK